MRTSPSSILQLLAELIQQEVIPWQQTAVVEQPQPCHEALVVRPPSTTVAVLGLVISAEQAPAIIIKPGHQEIPWSVLHLWSHRAQSVGISVETWRSKWPE